MSDYVSHLKRGVKHWKCSWF